MRSRTNILFNDQPLVLDASGILFFRQDRCLVVSDLHLEKASFFAQRGALLPRYDTRDSLQKLAQMIAEYAPQRVVCLGDSFHDRRSLDRLEMTERQMLIGMIDPLPEWYWILGNHDLTLPQELPGIYLPMLEIGGIRLLHEPDESNAPQIVGHFHPKCSYALGGQTVRGKSFIHDKQRLIMPAFGTYTGGLSIKHAAIQSQFTKPELYLCYKEGIWKIPYKDAF